MQNGYDALLRGGYTSAWRPNGSRVQRLEAVTEIRAGSKLSVVVETGDRSGKVLGSQTIELEPGKHDYSLKNVKAGDRIRIHAQLTSSTDGQSPVLRSVNIGIGKVLSDGVLRATGAMEPQKDRSQSMIPFHQEWDDPCGKICPKPTREPRSQETKNLAQMPQWISVAERAEMIPTSNPFQKVGLFLPRLTT